jgi:hypothetical protein
MLRAQDVARGVGNPTVYSPGSPAPTGATDAGGLDPRQYGLEQLLGAGRSIVSNASRNPALHRLEQAVITDDVVPAIHGELAGDEQRTLVVAVVDNLEQIAALLGIERLRSPIIDDEQSCAVAMMSAVVRNKPRQQSS